MVSSVKGTFDLFYPEVNKWQFIEESVRKVFSRYCFTEIRTPILEHTELFVRSVGSETDIVKKEMYTFLDKKGRSLTLRPENTAAVMRSVIEHNLYDSPRHQRLFYIGPQFRYERPQRGRYRQFHQIGIEILNDPSYIADFEGIMVALDLLNSLGIMDVRVELNSIGCKDCRPIYTPVLKEFLESNRDDLCSQCNERIERNPLRVLDCKVEGCQSVIKKSPLINKYLCDSCESHFSNLTSLLNYFDIDFKLNPRLVRGLDYYVKSVFELKSFKLGSQDAVLGGGRYDGLLAQLGGPDIPSFGWAIGFERLALISQFSKKEEKIIYICWMGEGSLKYALKCATFLRSKNLCVVIDGQERSLKNSLKRANKFEANFALIIGDEEVKSEVITIKNLLSGEQNALKLNEIPDFVLNGE